MTFNKNDILARLQNGDDLDTITKELTNALNEANAEYQKQREAQVATEDRYAAIRHITDAVKEYCRAADLDADDILDLKDEDIAALDHVFMEMLSATCQLKKAVHDIKLDSNTHIHTDDEVLAKFLDDLFGTSK